MEIIIERHLTQKERFAILNLAIEEIEKHGFGEVNIKIHNHQIVDVNSNKSIRFGNCSPEWYEAA
jgi:hypothetical protein